MTVILVGSAIYLLFALVLIYPIFKSAKRQKTQRGWAQYDGVVVAHEIQVNTFHARVKYLVRYESKLGMVESWGELAEQPTYSGGASRRIAPLDAGTLAAAKRPIGSSVRVALNPVDPIELVVLEREYPLAAFGVAICAVLAAFYVMILYAILA